MPRPDAVDPATIRLLVLDVDGVLTDGGIWLDCEGREIKRFHAHDGLGIQLWHEAGGKTAIITGRHSPAVAARARELNIPCVRQGVKDKLAVFAEILRELDLEATQAAMLGDDLPDLPVMLGSGYPMAVANAVREVQENAAYVTEMPGGAGAVRDAIKHLLTARNEWDEIVNQYRITP